VICDDASVPDGLGLLIDVRRHGPHILTHAEVEARIARMFEMLGAKVRSRCALVIGAATAEIRAGTPFAFSLH
jgi:hypothetical protein